MMGDTNIFSSVDPSCRLCSKEPRAKCMHHDNWPHEGKSCMHLAI